MSAIQAAWLMLIDLCRPEEPDVPTRTVTETTLRSFALHFVATAAFGHLLTLQNRIHTGQKTAALEIVMFIFLPTLPLAQLLQNIYWLFRRRPPYVNVSIYLALALGVKLPGSSDGNGGVSYHSVIRKTMPYGILWVGRSLVLCALLTQFTGTIFLWYRRAQSPVGLHRKFFEECQGRPMESKICRDRPLWPWNKLWAIDSRNFEVALAGLVIILSSLIIHMLNAEWSLREQTLASEPVQLAVHSESQIQDVIEPLAAVTRTALPNRAMGVELRPHSRNSRSSQVNRPILNQTNRLRWMNRRTTLTTCMDKASTQIKAGYAAFRLFNLNLSTLTFRICSRHRQQTLELAYTLRVLYLVLFPLDASIATANAFVDPKRFLSPSWVLFRLSITFKQARISQRQPIASSLELRYVQYQFLPMDNYASPSLVVIYLLPFTVLFASFIIQSSAHVVRALGFVIPFSNFWSEVNFWCRKERTVCFLLISLCMLFLIIVDIQFTAVDMIRMARLEQGIGAGGNLAGWFWKDTLADHLYII